MPMISPVCSPRRVQRTATRSPPAKTSWTSQLPSMPSWKTPIILAIGSGPSAPGIDGSWYS